MSIDALLPPSGGGSGDPIEERAAMVGRVASSPSGGTIEVVVPGYSAELRFGPCPYQPRGNAHPQRGQRALVVFTDDGPWVAAWGDVTDGSYPPEDKRGTAALTWPGGSASSGLQTFPHALGRVPTVVLLTPRSQAGIGVVAVECESATGTTFTVRGEVVSGASPPNTATTPFSYLVA